MGGFSVALLCNTCQCLCSQGSATLKKLKINWVKIPLKKKGLLGKVTAIFLVYILAKFCPKNTLVTISLSKRWQFYIIKMEIHFWRNVKVIGMCYIYLYIKIYIRRYVLAGADGVYQYQQLGLLKTQLLVMISLGLGLYIML
jgi:hypothetical protein